MGRTLSGSGRHGRETNRGGNIRGKGGGGEDRDERRQPLDSGRPVCYLLEPAAYDAMGAVASAVLPSVSAAMSYSGPAVLVFRRVQMLRIQGRTSRRAIQARPPRLAGPARPAPPGRPPVALCCPLLCPEGPALVDGRSVCLTTHEGGPMTRGPCGAVWRSERSSLKILPEPGEAQHTLIVPAAANALFLSPPARRGLQKKRHPHECSELLAVASIMGESFFLSSQTFLPGIGTWRDIPSSTYCTIDFFSRGTGTGPDILLLLPPHRASQPSQGCRDPAFVATTLPRPSQGSGSNLFFRILPGSPAVAGPALPPW